VNYRVELLEMLFIQLVEEAVVAADGPQVAVVLVLLAGLARLEKPAKGASRPGNCCS
jgi:hypothetical protein